MPHRDVSEPAPAARRPVVEVAAPGEPTGLDTGHTVPPRAGVTQTEPRQPQASTDVLALVLNGAAALVALAAAFSAARRRSCTNPIVGGQILRLPSAAFERRRAA